jgi:AcrR family transcriptional regulator
MAQRPKEHVREGIVRAAAGLFAEIGFPQATMAAVAARAGTSVGNVYKYFDGKDALLEAVLPSAFVDELHDLTRQRVEALGDVRDLRTLPPSSRYHVLAGELLDTALANRERVVILLGRAEGTPFASFASDFTDRLVTWALAYARKAYPSVRPSRGMRFALRRIYLGYFAAIADAFTVFHTEEAIRDAVSHLTAHHQGGLKNLFEVAASGKQAR